MERLVLHEEIDCLGNTKLEQGEGMILWFTQPSSCEMKEHTISQGIEFAVNFAEGSSPQPPVQPVKADASREVWITCQSRRGHQTTVYDLMWLLMLGQTDRTRCYEQY